MVTINELQMQINALLSQLQALQSIESQEKEKIRQEVKKEVKKEIVREIIGGFIWMIIFLGFGLVIYLSLSYIFKKYFSLPESWRLVIFSVFGSGIFSLLSVFLALWLPRLFQKREK